MGGVQVGWGGRVGEWEYERPVNGGDGERLLSNFLQPLLEKFTIRSCNDGSRELIPVFHNSPKTLTLSFGGGSHLGVPCRGAL